MKRVLLPLVFVGLLAGAARANEEASGAYLDGLDALAAGKYADAAKHFGKAIEAEEGNAAYYQARGVARTLAEDFPGALKDLQMAQKLVEARDWESAGWSATASKMNGHPEITFAPGTAPRPEQPYAIALSTMGQNYWSKKSKDDFGKVAAFYVEKHRALSGASGKAMLGRIEAKIAAGEYLDALVLLAPMIEANPGDVDLLAARAKALLSLGNWDGARKEYTDVLTRRPSAPAYIDRAIAGARMGDSNRVARDLAEALRLEPRMAETRKQVETSLAQNLAPGNPAELWQQLEKEAKRGDAAAQLQATALALLKTEGQVRVRYDEKYQERLAALETATIAHPNDAEAQIKLGRFLHDEADVLGEQVGPRAAPKPYRVQSDLDRKHELERSEQLVNTAMKEHPNNIGALTLKAQVLLAASRYDEAEEFVKKGLAIKGDDPDLLELLAGLLQINASIKVSQAGILKSVKSWEITNFDESPPKTYLYRRWPTKEELAQAAALENDARELLAYAQERIEQAEKKAGPTALGFYYKATVQRTRTDLEGAKESLLKAVTMQPDFELAWYQLAGVCTQLRDADGAVAARAKAYNLTHTTAAAELNALWFKIPHAQYKSARETAAAGVAIDPADARLPAYLGVIDEATEKPGEAMVHYRMAAAMCDAALALEGTQFGVVEKGKLMSTGEDAAQAAAVRMRIALLLLEQGKPAEAEAEFATVRTAMAFLVEGGSKGELAGAMLPNPDLPAGAVPLAETAETLRLRAATGESYAAWARAAKNPEETALAAKTYRRMFITYNMTTEGANALKAIADLGMAELYLSRGQIAEATASMKDTPAVPQDFWQEMRKTEGEIQQRQRGR